jgi:hypothetical protein
VDVRVGAIIAGHVLVLVWRPWLNGSMLLLVRACGRTVDVVLTLLLVGQRSRSDGRCLRYDLVARMLHRGWTGRRGVSGRCRGRRGSGIDRVRVGGQLWTREHTQDDIDDESASGPARPWRHECSTLGVHPLGVDPLRSCVGVVDRLFFFRPEKMLPIFTSRLAPPVRMN